jgi:serralysin
LKLSAGDFGCEVLLHELGHTLGLKHPGDYEHLSGSTDEGPFLPPARDSTDYTVMSYHDGSGHQYSGNYVVTPMLYDILAIQLLYGANMSAHAGSDRYTFETDSAPRCIWDAGGIDTFDFSLCKSFTTIDLNQGGFSSTSNGYGNISIAFDVTIERAVAGSGGSKIYGNDAGNVIYGGVGDDFIYLGEGNDTVNGGGGADIVIFDHALSQYTLSGNKTSLTVKGEGADVLNNIPMLYFSDLAIKPSSYVALTGGSGGDDVFRAGAGGELFSGGTGTDTVVYSGAPRDLTLTRCGDGHSFGVYDSVGTGGNDLVTGIERLRFSDGTGVALDIDGNAGQTYRMYQAAFDRTPDARGIGYWLDKMDHGLSLAGMAQHFLDSAESKATFGALSDTQFVNLMYANVLHRAPDAAGLDFYLKGFAAHAFERAAVLESFSESAENQAAVIGSITNGISYTVF